MSELEDQLAAFGRYLDDAEAGRIDAVVASQPANGGRRRNRLLRAAVILAVLAASAAVVVTVPERGSRVISPSDTSRWVEVPDPDGLFTQATAPAGDTVADGDGSLNKVLITGIASTSQGLVAVGAETINRTTVGALWQSQDGMEWSRLDHNPIFGTAAFTGAPGPTLRDVVEHDGRVAVLGYWPNHDSGRLWWSDDLDTWTTTTLPDPAPTTPSQAFALTAGDAGFVAAGYGIWTSSDAEHWTAVDVGSPGTFFSAVDFVADRYVAAGITQLGQLAVWTSTDGTHWAQSAVATAPDEEAASTGRYTIAEHRDIVIIVGIGHNYDGAQPDPPVWRSTDGAATWQRADGLTTPRESNQIVADVVVGTTDGFVAIAHHDTPIGEVNIEYRSTDGLTWAPTPLQIRGWRAAAVEFEHGAVAVGQQAEPQAIGTPPQAQDERGDEYSGTLTASIWTTTS